MADPVVVTNADGSTTTTVTNQDGTQTVTNTAAKAPDLMSRVSSFKKEAAATTTQTDAEKLGLTQEDWQAVQGNPSLKKYYNSMLSDYTKKTTEIAEQKRQYETLQKQNANWSPERIKELMADPNFVSAARQLETTQAPANSGMTNGEWSALSEQERAKLGAMEAKTKELELKQKQSEALLAQERVAAQDRELQSKYTDYSSDLVNNTITQLVGGKIQITREDIWKTINHDKHMANAYELGLQDGKTKGADRQASTTASTDAYTTQATTTIAPEKGESNKAFLSRVFTANLAKQRQ